MMNLFVEKNKKQNTRAKTETKLNDLALHEFS